MKQLTNFFNIIIGVILISGAIWYLVYLSPKNVNYTKKVAYEFQNQNKQTNHISQSDNVITHNKPKKKDYVVENIPAVYYENSTPRDQLYNVLNTNKKVITILCPEKSFLTKLFIYSFEKKLAKNVNKNYYYYIVFQYDDDYEYKCEKGGQYCAPRYLLEACTDKLCIVNPRKRQNLILTRLNPDIAMQILDQYKNW